MEALVTAFKGYMWPDSDDAEISPSPDLVPLPYLPPELHLLILSYALPPPSFNHHKQRAAFLVALSLLGSADLTSWAQRELHAHVRLLNLSAASRFLQHVGNVGAGDKVRSLRLGLDRTDAIRAAAGVIGHRRGVEEEQDGRVQQGWWGSGEVVGSLLENCPFVEELWIVGMSGMDAGCLSKGQNLRILAVVETRLTSSFSPTPLTDEDSEVAPLPLHLPHLHTLHLRSVILAGAISLPMLLNPLALPSLRSLAYLSVHHSLVAPSATMPPSLPAANASNSLAVLTAALGGASQARGGTSSSTFEHIAPQLVHLSLGEYASKTLGPEDVLLCSRLETLDVPLAYLDRLVSTSEREENISWLENLSGIRVRRDRLRERSPAEVEAILAAEAASGGVIEADRIVAKVVQLLRPGRSSNEIERLYIALPPSEQPSTDDEPPSIASRFRVTTLRAGEWDDQDVARDGAFDLSGEVWRSEVLKRIQVEKANS